MFKKILLVAALLIPMLASAQSLKIGLVDQNEIISKMPETTEAGKKVDEISKKYESEYMKLNDEMKRLYDEISNMKEDELPAIRERKTRDFTDHQVKVQQFQETAMQEIQRMQQELMAPIVQKVRSAIESVGKEGGFSLVQDKNPQITIYFDAPVIDITNDVKAKLGIK
ncbi:MAG: OmpH family outer membrane protein [Muribaculaceae bacterium]|nr:OmpH family outer membrane protein [Muribaculaceae bacterium]MDE6533813.1 OmpH family outer membrane protein [Muribaculaceae bacterium]